MSNEGLAKLQGLAQSTAATIRSASFKMRESLNQAGASEYSQKLAANVVNKGVPSVSEQLQEFFAQLWRRLIQFLESKGLKEPLERNYEKFRGLPIVQYLLKLFSDLLKVLFKSQFVQKVMGEQQNKQLVEEQRKEEGEEQIPLNGMKQDAPFTVMEALQKSAPGAPSTTDENGGTQNIVKPSQNINEKAQKSGNEQPATDQKIQQEQKLAVVEPVNIVKEQKVEVTPKKIENEQKVTPEPQKTANEQNVVKEQILAVEPKKIETQQKTAPEQTKIVKDQKVQPEQEKKPAIEPVNIVKEQKVSVEPKNIVKEQKASVEPKNIVKEQKLAVEPKKIDIAQKVTPEEPKKIVNNKVEQEQKLASEPKNIVKEQKEVVVEPKKNEMRLKLTDNDRKTTGQTINESQSMLLV
eukprot:TRINITY_DN7728_c0_g1_i6.p1 TRINITY_DN7728_c0_g1~~TRINITY_DN7728_c0_g1_i6.p1  ORF type:complete len:409 (+),score=70.20 TRINITY_DN7728_c0_g1_i6:437-1663(+)